MDGLKATGFTGHLEHVFGRAQTVGGALTRYSDAAGCVGNQIWIEIYTQIGASSTTLVYSA